MPDESLLTYILSGGAPVIALLLAIIYWGRKGIWHWHSELVSCQEATKHERERANEWRRVALEALGVAERAIPEATRRGHGS